MIIFYTRRYKTSHNKKEAKSMKQHQQELDKILLSVKERTIDTIYLVACGGSMAALAPMEFFFDLETDIQTKVYTSNEFVHRVPHRLNEKSLVITRSHSGTTPETVKAAKLARSKGALTIGISMVEDSPLCLACELILTYCYDKEKKFDRYEGDGSVGYRLLCELLRHFTGKKKYSYILEDLKKLENVLSDNEEKYKQEADEFGKNLKREEIIYTMASGAFYPEVYAWTSCLMMEMQWVHSNAIHSGEYFHGPFEITDFDVPFLVIKSQFETNYLDERAIKFAQKYSDRVYVLDTKDFIYSDIHEDSKEVFALLIASRVLRMFADQLGDHRGHPLSVRRYMWRMEY